MQLDLPGVKFTGTIKGAKPFKHEFGFTADGVSKDVAFKITQRRIYLNEVDHGPVNPGDRIRLTKDGELFVNDESRKPQGK